MFHDAKALVMPRLSCNGAKFGFHTKLQLLEISFVCANVGCFGSSKLQTISISTGLSNFNLSRFFFSSISFDWTSLGSMIYDSKIMTDIIFLWHVYVT